MKKKLTLAGLSKRLESWIMDFAKIWGKIEDKGGILDHLKALEEWKESLKLEKNQQIDGSGLGILLAPKTGFDTKNAEPLKLPCTTCKHWRPYYATIRLWKFKSERDHKFDECAIGGGMDKKHLGLPVKSEFCLVANSDQLCKFHSERNK